MLTDLIFNVGYVVIPVLCMRHPNCAHFIFPPRYRVLTIPTILTVFTVLTAPTLLVDFSGIALEVSNVPD